MIDYDNELNPQQKAVVFSGGGPILVLAGAGTGKTRTLVWRVARLLELGVRPEAICLLTFTNRAAHEMLERVASFGFPGARAIQGGTFHSVANAALRRHAHVLHLPRNYSILDTEDAHQVLTDAMNEVGLSRSGNDRIPGSRTLARLYSTCVNTSLTLEGAASLYAPHALESCDAIREVFRRFMQRKQDLHLLDFDDLLLNWFRLLRDVRTVRALYAAQFEHVLVDEYQDTNALQIGIVDRLSEVHGNLCVVGDDCQSIYAFRGVDWRNILRFQERYPNAKLHRLEINYRSTPQILHIANLSTTHNPAQLPKTLQPTRTHGALPVVARCTGRRQEAAFVAQRLLDARAEGHPWSSMAVLYRAHWHATELQVALAERHIPFKLRSGARFFEQEHIKDLLAPLRLIANPRDTSALRRAVLALPGLGERTGDRLTELVRVSEDPINALLDPRTHRLLPTKGRASFTRLSLLIRSLLQRNDLNAPAKALEFIVHTHAQPLFQERYDGADLQRRLDDIQPLLDFAQRFASLEDLLGHLVLLSSTFGQDLRISSKDDPNQDPDQSAVCLTTIHQAKGLEWPHVTLLGATHGSFPSWSAMERDELEEERRLFYVAVTRAQETFTATWPARIRNREGQWCWSEPSVFLSELQHGARRALWQEWRVRDGVQDDSEEMGDVDGRDTHS